MVPRILLGYKEALWPKKMEISHASQILTQEPQILVLSYLTNYYCTEQIKPSDLPVRTFYQLNSSMDYSRIHKNFREISVI